MITAAMVFVFTVSVFAGLAAGLADAGLRRLERPSRWIWLVAMAVGPAFLVLSMVGLGAGASAVAGGPLGSLPVVEIPGILVGEGSGAVFGLSVLDAVVAMIWLLAALLLLGTLVRARRTLVRERLGWTPARLLGREVLVSPDRGPAVAGFQRGWIVLPAWVLSLTQKEVRLILTHEEEHLRGRDPLLLAMAWGTLLLAPWNPVAWWQLRRLRTAMEVDCDRRVLARHLDRRAYGSSLLTVASRASGPSLALAAFSERSSDLEHRILTMTRIDSPWTRVSGVLFLVIASLVAVQACGVDDPAAQGGDITTPEVASTEETARAANRADLEREPTFTPFTVAPSITNRQEVVDAMQAEYPPLLREAGIGGTIRVYFFIDESGLVGDVRIDRSSGHVALDRAALAVADVYRFTPALNRDERVPVWVSFPITFQAGDG